MSPLMHTTSLCAPSVFFHHVLFSEACLEVQQDASDSKQEQACVKVQEDISSSSKHV